MKKFLSIAGVMIVLGVGFAYAVSDVGTKPLVRNGQEEVAAKVMAQVKHAVEERKAKGADAQIPHAFCDRDVHHFGLMDPLTVAEHSFRIENRGAAPLMLRGGASSCKCTLSDLTEAIVEPGDSYVVTLTWNSGHANQEFEQSALIHTNDPTNAELKLSVVGQVRAVLAALPLDINFDRLIPSTKASRQFALYSQVWPEMHVERIECTCEHFSATLSEGGFDQAVAFDDEVHEASSILPIRVDYDGEAPQGDVTARLRMYVRPPANWKSHSIELAENGNASPEPTNEQDAPASVAADSGDEGENELPEISFPTQDDGTVLVEVPIYGKVVRRLSLYGKPIQPGKVDLGTISPKDSEGRRWIIIGRVRGETLPEKVTAEVTGIPGLQVEVTEISSDQAKSSFRLTLTTSQKMRPAMYNREQAGKLVLRAEGMPAGDDQLELPIHLIVISN